MGRTLPRGLLEGDLHSPDVCMLLIIFFIFCSVRWSVSRDCNESITFKKRWFQITGSAISSMFGKYKWETEDISILPSYARTLERLHSVCVCVCVSVVTGLKQTLVWAGKCVSARQHCHTPGDGGELVSHHGRSAVTCNRWVVSLHPSDSYCHFPGSSGPNLSMKAGFNGLVFFVGKTRRPAPGHGKIYIVCTFIWSLASSEPRLETHTHLVYSCLTGRLFHQAGLHLCSTRIFF